MTTLVDNRAAFSHVIDSHRWLSASGCAWNLVGANGAQRGGFDADLPNIDVIVRDCLLLHARSLAKFYKGRRCPTDIMLCDFITSKIPPHLENELERYEHPIEIHLFHLTDYRDPGHRKNNPTTVRGKTSSRPDWDQEAPKIAELILECLKYVSGLSGPWQTPFKELFVAAENRYRDKSYSWPQNLCETSDVVRYLKSLGL